MAEIVGVVASVAQLLHLSGTLLAGGYGFLSMVKRAPSEIRTLLMETAAINAILAQITLAAETTPKSGLEDALQALTRLGVFQECQTALKSIGNALAKCEQLNGKDVKNFGRRLAWSLKEKETKEMLQQLHRLRSLLANAIELDTLSSIRSMEKGQKLLVDEMETVSSNVQTQISRDEAQKVISWVCPSPSDGAQISLQNALARRFAGTGTWFVESDIFQDWRNSEAGTLWVNGLPGSGKTLLCSSVIESVQQSMEDTTAVLFFFFDHRDHTKVNHDNFITNISKQVLDLSPLCLTDAKEIYNEKSKHGSQPSSGIDYVPFIGSSLRHFKEVILFVDALDESTEREAIADTLTRLHSYGRQHNYSIKIFLTSRFDVLLEKLHPNLTSTRITLGKNMGHDIERFIGLDLELRTSKGTLKLRNKDLLALIQERVCACAGTPLQARLQIDYISTAKTDRDVRAMICTLPNGLEFTYDTLLCQAASKYPEHKHEIKTLLQCLVAASSPLTPSQLSEILAMQPGARYLDFDSVATDPYDTLELIAPLVIIDTEGNENGVVKLCHYSLEEYLCSTSIRQSSARYFYVDKAEANTWLASVCLQYLTFEVFCKPIDKDSGLPSLEMYALYQYAVSNWFIHANLAGLAAQRIPYVGLFLDNDEGPPCYDMWQQVFYKEHLANAFISKYHAPICFLICAGINDLALGLLPTLPNPDHYFLDGFTCLTVAARYNNLYMAQKLLEIGADIEKPTQEPDFERRLTPLHLAAEFRSRETFDFLLVAGAHPHVRSRSLTTPFYRACRGGDLHIVQRLKDCGSDIDACTWSNWTPLMDAVYSYNEDVVDMLLGWGADVTVESDEGWTALILAAYRPGILEKLVKFMATPTIRDTALITVNKDHEVL